MNDALFESDLEEIVIMKDMSSIRSANTICCRSSASVTSDTYRTGTCSACRRSQQIAQSILNVTHASGVGVIIEAQHLCTAMRGVEKQHSVMKTSVLLGSFRDNAPTRAEFLQLVGD